MKAIKANAHESKSQSNCRRFPTGKSAGSLLALLALVMLAGPGGASENEQGAASLKVARWLNGTETTESMFTLARKPDTCFDHYRMCRTYDTYANCRAEMMRCLGR